MASSFDSNPNLADPKNAGNSTTDSKLDGASPANGKESENKKMFNYPLVRFSDMHDELRIETVDMVVTYLEKHPGNYEAAAKNVKEVMDKKCGTSWHVIIGEGFEFEITHEMKNLLFMFFGSLGVLVWKAS
ncbi:hypothetical protein BKA69DRAFT_1056915 [Paraphysoderma sedebokerense]|nr:hypothetical protein BKA69DRAFT_1056915 [Paraphysoderma sedebokerense]